MSYTPQPNSLAGRVVAHFRGQSKCRELSEAQIAEQFKAPLSSVTACLAASVQYKLLDRVRCDNGRMGYAPGRKLHGSNEADKQGLVAPPGPAPAPTAARKAPAPTAAPAPAPAPVAAPAPMAAAVRTLMAPPPAPAPSPATPSTPPTAKPSLLERLPAPESLRISSKAEEELQQAVAAYDALLAGLGVGQFLIVPAHAGDDVLRVCRAWGRSHAANFTVLDCTTDEMRIQRAA